MRKTAVISDLHGNFQALSAVVEEARKEGCDACVCCGDYVGYYYDTMSVVSLMRRLCTVAILGNHDRDFIALADGLWQITPEYRRKYGSALEIALSDMDETSLGWLRTLPEASEFAVESRRFLLCHGSPWDSDEYVYPDVGQGILDRIYALGYDGVVFGHSHYQFLRQNGAQFILNPGSVGQPRDGRGAAWAILEADADDVKVDLKRTEFDVETVLRQIQQFDPSSPYLADVLQRSSHGL